MKMIIKRLALGIASAGVLTIYGCGGGSSSAVVTPPGPTAATIQGTAATGAAFVDAVVTVLDSTGALVGTSSPVGADGVFSVTLTSGAKPPYVLVASRTTADGEVQTLVSVAESASATTANITPITNLIASRLSPTGDPLKLVSELAAGTAKITPVAVAATVAEVKQILATLLAASGTTDADPLKSAFSTNGTGYDRLLDSLKISITPANASSTNIEIAVKQQLADGTQPTVIQFVSSSTSVASLPPVDSATLVASGTSVLIADLLKSLSACYALPLTDRVNTAGTGVAADITAATCKNVFFGNSPSNFKSNGNVVGLGKAFNGIYTSGGTGLVFSQGSYEFTRGNGDLVIGYKSRDASGNEVFDTFAVRIDTDGKLKLIGNQYQYPGGVSAYHQFRQFITLNQSAYNYYSTGYNLGIFDVKGGTGVGGSIFDRVVVTVPNGNTVTLKPSAGFSNLNLILPTGTLPSGTSYVRLRSVFANTATTGDIAAKDNQLFFVPTAFTESEVAAIPAQSVWKFEYYLAANSTVIAATQQYKTRTRALTIEELKLQGLAQLSTAVITDLQTNTALVSGKAQLPNNGPVSDIDYTVPTGALPITAIKIFGQRLNLPSGTSIPGGSFEDSIKVGSTARKGTIPCAPASGTDFHCRSGAGTYAAGAYTTDAYATGLHLFSRDASGREYASFYAMYPLR